MRDGIADVERTARPRIVRAPVEEEFAYALVAVQEVHRPGIETLLSELPGRPTIWYLGNTTQGYDRAGDLLGRDRVVGGFPGVGGTWDGDVLLYADRQTTSDSPFDKLVIGEALPEAARAAKQVADHLSGAGMNVERHVPIMAWHWSHVALILPLAGAYYSHDASPAAVASDRGLHRRTMRATAQAMSAVRRAGFPILPRGLRLLRWIPTGIGARKIGSLLGSRFGQIALAGHAATARDEMRSLARDLLDLAGERVGPELRVLLEGI